MADNAVCAAVSQQGSSDAKRRLRILACHRFFWPDTPPYASILRALATEFSSQGHDVSVFSAQPSYKPEVDLPRQPAREVVDGITVLRCKVIKERDRNVLLRMANNAYFCLRVFVHLIVSRRYDVVMVSTFPPIMLAFLAAFAAKLRGSRFIYHCMDLHPEVMKLAGTIKGERILDWLTRLDRWTCRTADPVVVLSEDMKNTLLARGGVDVSDIVVINNFELPDFDEIDSQLEVDAFRSDGLRLLFAGNVGRFQGLENLIEAVARVPEVELVMLGDGAARESLEIMAKSYPGSSIRFMNHVPAGVAKSLMRTADLGVVSLAQEVYRVAYPSKTMTYLSCGLPVLALVEPVSELARTINANKLGYTAPLNHIEALVTVLKQAVRERAALEATKATAAEYAQGQFALSVAMEKWNRLISKCDAVRT
jgi:glycosyltransferase involved in cell wall biosynthesis